MKRLLRGLIEWILRDEGRSSRNECAPLGGGGGFIHPYFSNGQFSTTIRISKCDNGYLISMSWEDSTGKEQYFNRLLPEGGDIFETLRDMLVLKVLK